MAVGFGVVLVTIAALSGQLGWLFSTDRVSRNRLVGIRTRSTLASDRAWYAAHRASAWTFYAASAVTGAIGVVLLVARMSTGDANAAFRAGVLSLFAFVIAGGVQAEVAARKVK